MSLATVRPEIENLYGTYALAIDDNDFAGVLACFAPDAILEIPGVGTFAGREEIEGSLRRSADGRGHHFAANLVIRRLTADAADAEASFQVWSGGGELSGLGRYVDTLARGGRWGWWWTRRVIEYRWIREDYTYGR